MQPCTYIYVHMLWNDIALTSEHKTFNFTGGYANKVEIYNKKTDLVCFVSI